MSQSIDYDKNELTQRQINSLETKEALLNSAVTLFKTYGYDNVTVDEISANAGVSKGSFYTHFHSKESIFVEEFAKIDSYYDVMLNKLPKDASSSQKIRTMFRAMCDYCEHICGLEFIRVVYMNQMSNKKNNLIINNKDRNLYKKYTEIVNEGIASGEFKIKLSEEYIVELIVRASRSLLYDRCLYDGKFSLYEEGKIFVELIINVLRGEIVEYPSFD